MDGAVGAILSVETEARVYWGRRIYGVIHALKPASYAGAGDRPGGEILWTACVAVELSLD